MIINLDEIDSTNEYLKRMSNDGYNSDEMLVVTAQYQTSGKGRRGRSWVTEPGTALMFSVLLKPRLKLDDCSMLTLVMALAVKRSLSDMDIEAMIKWPNDILYQGKKLVGISTEMNAEIDRVNYVVIGIGINALVQPEAFPEDIRDKAGSMSMFIGDFDRIAFFQQVIRNLEKLYLEVRGQGFDRVLDQWRQLSVTLGEEVNVIGIKETFAGRAVDIAEDGALLIDTGNEVRKVYAGDVSIRPRQH